MIHSLSAVVTPFVTPYSYLIICNRVSCTAQKLDLKISGQEDDDVFEEVYSGEGESDSNVGSVSSSR